MTIYNELTCKYGEKIKWLERFKFGDDESNGYSPQYKSAYFEKEEFIKDMLNIFSPDNRNLRANTVLSHEHIPHRLAGGATQVGKTWFKILTALCGKQQEVATIIVTTTVSGALELTRKIGLEIEQYGVSVAYYTREWKEGKFDSAKAMVHGELC